MMNVGDLILFCLGRYQELYLYSVSLTVCTLWALATQFVCVLHHHHHHFFNFASSCKRQQQQQPEVELESSCGLSDWLQKFTINL